MSEDEGNKDPYKGFVEIHIEGTPTIDTNLGELPVSGLKAMNIKGYGCIVVRWKGGESYTESSMSIPGVLATEVDGNFVLSKN